LNKYVEAFYYLEEVFIMVRSTAPIPGYPNLSRTEVFRIQQEEIPRYGRPMFMWLKPPGDIRDCARVKCRSVDAQAALAMLVNNVTPGVALKPDELIVYGGTGRAARNWLEFNRIRAVLEVLTDEETLLIQSGRPVGVVRSHPNAPRVLLANSNMVWPSDARFNALDRAGLMMYGQMTAGSWIYIGTQGILQGTYETFAGAARESLRVDSLQGKWVLTAGMGAMSGAQPIAVTFNGGVVLDVEVRRERIEWKVQEGYCDRITDSLDEALRWVEEAKTRGQALSIGLVGNAAVVYPELVRRNVIPDIVTDQTSAHNPLTYVPPGDLDEVDRLRVENPDEYVRRVRAAEVVHVQAILDMQRLGAVAVDYGNNLRDEAEKGGLTVRDADGDYLYPGFVPAYIRPRFERGYGPFRWAAVSGNPNDILTTDRAMMELFSESEEPGLHRWIRMVQERLPFSRLPGLPTRICWLGFGQRDRAGLMFNDLVKKDKVSGPLVIGRDHLDCGSVCSPPRETEGMLDGSDAVADWPLLNALINTANGASWVSVHNGGGVGIGNALHAGMVIVADGTPERAKRLERVLTSDPGTGILRHADAGYSAAQAVLDGEMAGARRIWIPES
jgi:urocanate hydratase